MLQTLFFAVMGEDGSTGGSAQATDFIAYVTTQYPDTSARWLFYETESEFDDVISGGDYSRNMDNNDPPGFIAGIVFSAGSPDWEYMVRIERKYYGQASHVPEDFLGTGWVVGVGEGVKAL